MMRWNICGWILTGLLCTVPCRAAPLPYDFSFVNPLQATVIGTPEAYKPDLPKAVPTRIYRIETLLERKVPQIFWYQDALEFSLVHQKQPAPLIFIIAGTGAEYHSAKMLDMQKAFYQAGFHILSLSSPTMMNFIPTFPTSDPPNHPEEVAKDLYRVMARIKSVLAQQSYFRQLHPSLAESLPRDLTTPLHPAAEHAFREAELSR